MKGFNKRAGGERVDIVGRIKFREKEIFRVRRENRGKNRGVREGSYKREGGGVDIGKEVLGTRTIDNKMRRDRESTAGGEGSIDRKGEEAEGS